MLALSLFGSLHVSLRVADDVRGLTLAPRSAELLAYLALGRGRYFAREEITSQVWGDQDRDIGRGSVSTALWRLRRCLEQPPAKSGDFIRINRQGAIGLNGAAPICLDVAEFERLTRVGLCKPHTQLTDDEAVTLANAVDMYTDNLLSEFSSDWVLRERERLRRIYIDSLGQLMQCCADRQLYSTAIRYGQRILDADSLREDVHRDLMRFFVRNGQRAQALCQFETCRKALRRELAIQPMPETLGLYQQIADSALIAR